MVERLGVLLTEGEKFINIKILQLIKAIIISKVYHNITKY